MGGPRGLGEEIPDLPRPQYEALIPFISDPFVIWIDKYDL